MMAGVHVGVQLPQNEVGVDPGAMRELVQGIRDLGYHHVTVLDHVVGADRGTYGDKDYLPYDATSVIHEPFVLFGFIAACAPELHLLSAILVLPQRQTALVAKQMAEVDILASGKTRLGVGVGWNDVEYEALGMSFKTRGHRLEEQVALLRRLWTEPVVSFDGEFDRMRASPSIRCRSSGRSRSGSAARSSGPATEPPSSATGLSCSWPLPDRPLESDWPEKMDEMRRWRREAGLEAMSASRRGHRRSRALAGGVATNGRRVAAARRQPSRHPHAAPWPRHGRGATRTICARTRRTRRSDAGVSPAPHRRTSLGVHRLVVPTPYAVGDANAYLIDDDPLTLIDTGPTAAVSLEALEAELAASADRSRRSS